MSMALVGFGVMILFLTSAPVKLSVWRADHGWGQPILMIVLWRGVHLIDGDEKGR